MPSVAGFGRTHGHGKRPGESLRDKLEARSRRTRRFEGGQDLDGGGEW